MNSVGKRLRQLATAIQVLVLATSMGLPFLGQQAFADSTPQALYFGISNQSWDTTVGPDGNLWFADGRYIGRMTNNGVVDRDYYSSDDTLIQSITAGPDGALWFTNSYNIGRMTTDGVATIYQLDDARPNDITAGPDGAIWFADAGGHNVGKIGRITTDGTIIEYPTPTLYSVPSQIVAGPDGALWFTEEYGGIGRITTDGSITEYHVGSYDQGIAAGPDGALWFTEVGNNAIGRITTDGVYTTYPLPLPNANPYYITSGPDGAMWFTEEGSNITTARIGRITTDGLLTQYLQPYVVPQGITSGPDGALWFAAGRNIGRITSPLAPAVPMNLIASTVSGAPILTWDLAVGATSYDIYRDNGTKIGLSSTNTFVDSTPLGGKHTYYVEAVSQGLSSNPSNTVEVTIDTTPPTITYTTTPAPNAQGWNNTSVTVDFTCNDDTAVAACSDPVTLGTDGAGQTATGTAADTAGNSASVTAGPINIDKTPPTITALVSPAANSYGWNNSNVTVSFTCADGLSGVATCPGPVTIGSEAANQVVTRTATDVAGNQASASVTVNLDKTKPTATNANMTNTFILFQANETFTADAADTLSGVVSGEYYIDTDPGQGNGHAMTYGAGHLTASATLGTGSGLSIGNHTLYIRVKDKAGNWSTVATRTFLYI